MTSRCDRDSPGSIPGGSTNFAGVGGRSKAKKPTAGFEPATPALRRQCNDRYATTAQELLVKMATTEGFEPSRA